MPFTLGLPVIAAWDGDTFTEAGLADARSSNRLSGIQEFAVSSKMVDGMGVSCHNFGTRQGGWKRNCRTIRSREGREGYISSVTATVRR